MKNLMVINYQPGGKASRWELQTLAETQIENSLALGWRAEDLVLVTNLEIDAPVTLVPAGLHAACLTGAKMFALEHLFAQGAIVEGEMWWAHDLDAWQNYAFDEPEIRDVGLAEYSRPRFNGGSIFLRHTARDLVCAITGHIRENALVKEEPAINKLLRSPAHFPRVTVLNSTYNVGCSAYAVRHARSYKPILVSHFHPTRGGAWRTHVDGRNELGEGSVSPRLRELLTRRIHRREPANFESPAVTAA